MNKKKFHTSYLLKLFVSTLSVLIIYGYITNPVYSSETVYSYETNSQNTNHECSCPVPGDLNGDGNITPQDALIAFKCYLGQVDYFDGADVNQNREVTPADALCIFNRYLGKPSCLDEIYKRQDNIDNICNKDVSVNNLLLTNALNNDDDGSGVNPVNPKMSNLEGEKTTEEGEYYKYILVLMLDGILDSGNIKTQVLRCLKEDYDGERFKYAWYYMASHPQTSQADIRNKLDYLRNKYYDNCPRNRFSVVMVGKSLGAARLYKTVTYQSPTFDDYHLIGIVYVDTHEHVCPGDEGRCDYWYDWVIFRCDGSGSGWNNYYDLKAHMGNTNVPSHFREYNVHQRRDWPRGYAFTHLGSRNIKENTSGTEHMNIIWTSAAKERIQWAISFALGQHHNPYNYSNAYRVLCVPGSSGSDCASGSDYCSSSSNGPYPLCCSGYCINNHCVDCASGSDFCSSSSSGPYPLCCSGFCNSNNHCTLP